MILTFEKSDELNKSESKTVPLRLDYIEKQEIDSVNGPFQLVHADIGHFIFSGKSTAAHPKYCLRAVDVYSSKVYVYSMEQRDLLTKKVFCKDIQPKRKKKKFRFASRSRISKKLNKRTK